MAIYSFKNERARKILFEIACTSEEPDYYSGVNELADRATYYLAIFSDSEDLLFRVKTLLKERIDVLQKEEPESSRRLLSGVIFGD